jgi:hypothetical protein
MVSVGQKPASVWRIPQMENCTMIHIPRDIGLIRAALMLAWLPMSSTLPGATTAHPADSRFSDRWSLEYGVAFITSQNIGDLMSGEVNIDDGPAGGEIHYLTASCLLAEPEWCLFGKTFHPALELPFTLGIVDENAGSPFSSYSVSFVVRWRDFPWNDRVLTAFSTGVGLMWSSEVHAMDIQRHPGDDRSRWKFNWPLQLSLAHPSHPCHQVVLFIAHHSGGRIFDRGGINSLGIGYRFASW